MQGVGMQWGAWVWVQVPCASAMRGVQVQCMRMQVQMCKCNGWGCMCNGSLLLQSSLMILVGLGTAQCLEDGSKV
jgi:hypothetical protein